MTYRVGIKLVVSPVGLDRRVALRVFLDELLGTLDASRTHSYDGVCDVGNPTANPCVNYADHGWISCSYNALFGIFQQVL